MASADAMNKPKIAYKSYVLILSFVLTFSFISNAASKPENTEISVKVSETPLGPEVEASAKVAFTPLMFIELVKNAKHDCSWIAKCESVNILEGEDSNFQLIRTEIKAPWPFNNRDMVVYSMLEYNEATKHLSIQLTQAENAELESHLVSSDDIKGIVRMTNVKAKWEMQALGNQQFLLEYRGVASPNGNIPDWIARRFVRQSTEETFENVIAHFAKMHPQ